MTRREFTKSRELLTHRQNEAGLTLVELLISAALLLILIGPLLSFMRAGQINRSTSIRLADVEQNTRAAMVSIGRDIANAGYNFAPQVDLGTTTFLRTLLGTNGPNTNPLSPIIPGNNLNLVRTVNAMGTTVTSMTDQITFVFVDQAFNNGLPLSGELTPSGNMYTSNSPVTGLFPGDFVILGKGGQFAIAVATKVDDTKVLFDDSDPFEVNKPGNGPLRDLNALDTDDNVSLYKFFLVSYFVDGNGNLIRREQLPPPHTQFGGNNNTTPVALTPDDRTYPCAGTCYYDNIIATGIEDLQFTYTIVDPSGMGRPVGTVADPGFLSSTTNGGVVPNFRLLDIRQVNVSIKARASERDTKIRDPYNRNQGYLYRFSLEGSFNTRNFYGSDYRP